MLNFKFGDDIIEVTDSTSFFGVVLDNSLSFTGHIDNMCPRLAKTIGLIYKDFSSRQLNCIKASCIRSFFMPSKHIIRGVPNIDF